MMKTDKKSNYVRLRIYDDELLTLIDELENSSMFKSRTDVLNQALKYGIAFLYKECFGKKLVETGMLFQNNQNNDDIILKKLKEINLTVDDIFVVLNLIEYITTTIYNIEVAKLNGVSIHDDDIRSGLYAMLPDTLQQVKDEIVYRNNKNRGKK